MDCSCMQGSIGVAGDLKRSHLKVKVGANDYRGGSCHNSLVSKGDFMK